ncbi:MAG: hydrogenase iron-sulfur subunit [Vampirovibrionales bacterium]|nr:hydrogenase iron-sulfur subunit [Vampirovibrionales bacterium]
MSSQKAEIIGIVCERSVDFKGKLDENGCLLDDPKVKIVQVPCSGQIQPIMIETALKKGAKGVFTTGCRIGDCHYREGNKFLKERLMGKRMPKLKPTVDKTKLDAYWLSAVEYDKLRDMLSEFSTRCCSGACPTEALSVK